MTEFLVPEKDPTKQREWAIDVLSCTSLKDDAGMLL